MPFRAGFEIQGLTRPKVEDFPRRHRLEHHGHHIVLRPIVLISRRVGKQLANGDLAGSGEVGNEPGNFIVE